MGSTITSSIEFDTSRSEIKAHMWTAKLECLLWIWWALAAWVALAAVLAFPLYKRIPVGYLPVFVGLVIALGLGHLPRPLLRHLRSLLYGGNSRGWLTVVCFTGILVRLPVIIYPSVPHTDHRTYYKLAIQLASGAGYGNSILYPPGQPGWLSLWVRVFGASLHSLVAVQCGLCVASILLLYYSLRPYSEAAARWGCLIIAFLPSIVLYSGTLGHETTSVFSNIALLSLFLFATKARGWRGFTAWIVLGCAAAFAAFVHPTFLVLPVVLGFALLFVATSPAGLFWRVAAATFAMAAAIFPWSLRNYKLYGEFSVISTNFGSVLLSSNSPASDGLYMNTDPIGANLSPIEQDRFQKHLALAAIRNDPWTFSKRVVKRLVFMWGTDTSVLDFVLGDNAPAGITPLRAFLSAVIQVFWAWFVLAWCISTVTRPPWKFRHASFEIWAACWVGVIWVLHSVVEPHSRHHLPVLPFIGLVALPAYWSWVENGALKNSKDLLTGRSEYKTDW
jgi:hypothetical protein